MLTKRLYILLLPALLLLTAGCAHELTFQNEESGGGADLTLSLGTEVIKAYWEGERPESAGDVTRASMTETEYEDWNEQRDQEFKNIESLALFVVRYDENMSNGYAVAYRLLVNKTEEDGKRYLYYNRENQLQNPEDPESAPFENVELAYLDGLYVSPTDDWDDHDLIQSLTDPAAYGSNDWTDRNSPEKILLTFSFNNPLHGPVEKLDSKGRYEIFAFTNFTEMSPRIQGIPLGMFIYEMIEYWQGHMNDTDFKGIPISIEEEEEEEDPITHSRFKGCGDLEYPVIISDVTTPFSAGASSYSTEDVLTSPSFLIHSNTTLISLKTLRNCRFFPGENKIDMTVKSYPSRVTFNVANYADACVKLTGFSLCDKFARAAFNLFEEEDGQYEHFPNWMGAPVVTSDRAIWPYKENRYYGTEERLQALSNYEEIHASGLDYTLPKGGSAPIFDAFLVGGYDPDSPLSFSITAELADVFSESQEVFDDCSILDDSLSTYNEITALVNDNAAWPVGEKRYFLMQSIVKENQGTYANKVIHPFIRIDAGLMKGSTADGQADRNTKITNIHSLLNAKTDLTYMWVFEKVETGKVIIQNLGTGEYCKVNSADEANVAFTSKKNEAASFTIGRYSGENGATGGTYYDDVSKNVPTSGYTYNYALPFANGAAVGFETTIGGKTVYMNMYSWNKDLKVATMQKWSDGGAHFWLIPVEAHFHTDYSSPLPPKSLTNRQLNVFTDHDGTLVPLHGLRHGEHLTVTINILYNEESQEIEFEVKGEKNGTIKGWHLSDNDVTFN